MAKEKQVGFNTSVFTGTKERDSAGSNLAKVLITGLGAVSEVNKINRLEEEREYRRKNIAEEENRQNDMVKINDWNNRLAQRKLEANFETLDYQGRKELVDSFRKENELLPSTVYGEQKLNDLNTNEDEYLNKYMNAENKLVFSNYVDDNIHNMRTMDDIDTMLMSGKTLDPNLTKSDLLKKYGRDIYEKTDWTKYSGKTKKQILKDMPLLTEIQDVSFKKEAMAQINKIDAITVSQINRRNQINSVQKALQSGDTFALMSIYNKKIKSYDNNGNQITESVKDIVEDTVNKTFLSNPEKGIELSNRSGARIQILDDRVEAFSKGAFTDVNSVNSALGYYSLAVSKGYSFDNKIDVLMEEVKQYSSLTPTTDNSGNPLSQEQILIDRANSALTVINGQGKKAKDLNSKTEMAILDDLDLDIDESTTQQALIDAKRIFQYSSGTPEAFKSILKSQYQRLEKTTVDGTVKLGTYIKEEELELFKDNLSKLGQEKVKFTYIGSNPQSGDTFMMTYKDNVDNEYSMEIRGSDIQSALIKTTQKVKDKIDAMPEEQKKDYLAGGKALRFVKEKWSDLDANTFGDTLSATSSLIDSVFENFGNTEGKVSYFSGLEGKKVEKKKEPAELVDLFPNKPTKEMIELGSTITTGLSISGAMSKQDKKQFSSAIKSIAKEVNKNPDVDIAEGVKQTKKIVNDAVIKKLIKTKWFIDNERDINNDIKALTYYHYLDERIDKDGIKSTSFLSSVNKLYEYINGYDESVKAEDKRVFINNLFKDLRAKYGNMSQQEKLNSINDLEALIKVR